ncbi:hypothetical protein ACWEJ6_46610 [Nonomuraea sp. NPDC004702]
MTAAPLECGVVSNHAIARALGISSFRASGSTSVKNFSHCIISRFPATEKKARMSIELYDPFASTLDSLEYTKTQEDGTNLPAEIQPGFSSLMEDADGNVIGARALAWTSDGTKLLSVMIARGAPGRDHVADVIEFTRKLRPLLLSSTRG